MANCDVCLDRSVCVACSQGYELVFDGQACKKETGEKDNGTDETEKKSNGEQRNKIDSDTADEASTEKN